MSQCSTNDGLPGIEGPGGAAGERSRISWHGFSSNWDFMNFIDVHDFLEACFDICIDFHGFLSILVISVIFSDSLVSGFFLFRHEPPDPGFSGKCVGFD